MKLDTFWNYGYFYFFEDFKDVQSCIAKVIEHILYALKEADLEVVQAEISFCKEIIYPDLVRFMFKPLCITRRKK